MAKKSPPAFQFYASDWLGSTRVALMSLEQVGAYILLLAHAWADEDCSLPSDDRSLAVLSRMGSRWVRHGRQILDCFEPHPSLPGRLINAKLWAVRERAAEMAARGSTGGKRSAGIRWGGKQNGKQGGKQNVSGAVTLKSPDASNPPGSRLQSPTSGDKQTASSDHPASEEIILPPEKQSESAKPPPPAAFGLAERLRDGILAHKPDAKLPAKLDGWANTFRLMLERDGRSPDRVAAVIDWTTAEPFWQPNVLSADKLREKFDVLEGQMRRARTPTATRPGHTSVADQSIENAKAVLAEMRGGGQ